MNNRVSYEILMDPNQLTCHTQDPSILVLLMGKPLLHDNKS